MLRIFSYSIRTPLITKTHVPSPPREQRKLQIHRTKWSRAIQNYRQNQAAIKAKQWESLSRNEIRNSSMVVTVRAIAS